MTLYSIDGIQVELPPEGDYWIAPNAVLIGRVKLEHLASVWFGAMIPGITIPSYWCANHIQDGCVYKRTWYR